MSVGTNSNVLVLWLLLSWLSLRAGDASGPPPPGPSRCPDGDAAFELSTGFVFTAPHAILDTR